MSAAKIFRARNIRDFSQRLDPWIQKKMPEQVVCRGTVKGLRQFKGCDFFDLTDNEQSIRCFIGYDARKSIGQTLENGMVLDVAGHMGIYAKETRLQIMVDSFRPLPNLNAPSPLKTKVYSPTELTAGIKTALERVAAPYEFHVSGAIASPRPFAKYTVFDLGDTESAIRCIRFHDTRFGKDMAFEKDAEISIIGKLELYKNATLQMKLMDAMPSEEGLLIRQLKREGLWPKQPKPMPETIQRIGLITSESSQAYKDFTTIYQREGGQAEIEPMLVNVQGANAVEGIVRAVNRLKQERKVEAILITRGGGDAEDIAEVFDDYRLAEAICHSPIFVMTAIGHASNQTFADEVADKSVATPTDAAYTLAKIPAAATRKRGLFR